MIPLIFVVWRCSLVNAPVCRKVGPRFESGPWGDSSSLRNSDKDIVKGEGLRTIMHSQSGVTPLNKFIYLKKIFPSTSTPMKGTKRLPDVVDQLDHMEEAEADQEYQGEYETVELGPAHSGT